MKPASFSQRTSIPKAQRETAQQETEKRETKKSQKT